MKSNFLFPFWCRFLGWGLFLVHIPVVTFRNDLGFNFHEESSPQGLFNSHHVFFLCTALLMTVGLFLVAFSKEKIEDEQIWHLRLESLRWAIYVNYLILVISLVFIDDVHHIMELNLWVPLIFFIIRFRWVIFRLNRSLSREG
ncbi:MAG TPA: hypothetical protein VK671_13125 [Mucilaginibacter sp.]|jgi:hypothetical protein|nr:hypothetical protein [Mucilaginibacter sp.]